MKTINQAIETARQFDRLFSQVKREQRKRSPDQQRIKRLSRAAKQVSKQLSRLLRLLSAKPQRVKQGVKQQI